MINVFQQDFKIVPSREMDYMQIERVKKVETVNKHLTYALIAAAVVIGTVAIIEINQILKEEEQGKSRF